MSERNAHSAAGQMAGYLFQPERALFRLATSSRDDVIGIETLDDIAVVSPDGSTKLEQAKHYVSDANLSGRGKDFWKSLNIWLEAIENEEVEISKTEFFLVTNKTASSGLITDLKSLPDTEKNREEWVAKLRAVGHAPSDSIKDYVNSVLKRGDDDLKKLVKQIHVIDATDASHGEKLREQIADGLHLAKENEREIIDSLLGWVHSTTLDLIRAGKPVWLTRENFDERLRRLNYQFQDKKLIQETAEALIPVTEQDRAARKSKLFVKQLQWLGLSDDDEQILEAIDDHIRSGTEAINLSRKGVVSKNDFEAFDDRLIKRWKNLKRQHTPTQLPTEEEKKQSVGKAILHNTMGYCESLAGQPTSELYLTQGAYHRLADAPPSVGWHPDYEQKINLLTEEDKQNETSK